jgi:hypothetical protein
MNPIRNVLFRNAYLASFPYGQCMDWTTHVDQCPGEEAANTTLPNLCSGYNTCGSVSDTERKFF